MNSDILLEYINQGKVLIFDLDDTLYDEKSYLFPRYKFLCKKLYGNNFSEPLDFLINGFLKGHRRDLFNKMLLNYPSELSISKVLEIFRDSDYRDKLYFFPWVYHLFNKLPDGYHMRIITNGNVQQQKNKVLSLFGGLERDKIKITIVYANEYAPKPSPNSFLSLDLKPSSVIYIGDSESDKEFCRNANLTFLSSV